jgi:hypothetical protein
MTGRTHPPAAARRRRLPGRREWLLVLVSSCVWLALLEFALRAFAPMYSSVFQPDDLTLVSLVPGGHMSVTRLRINGGQHHIVEINGEGFRGGPLRPVAGQQRVIVYGDSNVFAAFSDQPATFTARLGVELAKRPGRDVETINAGISGAGPDQELLRMPGDVARLKPALVVVVIYADNDFGDLLRNRIFVGDASGRVTQQHAVLSPVDRENIRLASHPTGFRALQLWRRFGSLYEMLRERVAGPRQAADEIARYVELSLEKDQNQYEAFERATDKRVAENPFRDSYDADIALTPDSPSAQLKMALMRHVVAQLGSTARSLNVPLAVLILPSGIDTGDHYDWQVDVRKYPQYVRSRLSDLVAADAAQAGIAALNLFPDWRARDVNALYFHGGDDHWNDAGQALAARQMAEFIDAHGLLGPSTR